MNNRQRFAEVHQPCPCGSSSDAYCIREDKSGFCFSCNQDFQDGKISTEKHVDVEFKYLSHRSISRRTFEFYGVQTKLADGKPVEVAFPYSDDSVKVRDLNVKENMRCIGGFQAAGLFGQRLFDPGSKESICIVEGEFDALAAYEMLRQKVAVVSIKSGAGSAARDLSRRDIWEYVNSFQKIYFCFDNDGPGKDATKAVQGIFDFRKTYHVPLTKYKDPNDYLAAGDADGFEATYHAAKRFAPDNIISSFSDISAALEVSSEDKLGEYPFPILNDKLYGLHAGEVIVIKAPEGVGKTEFFRSIESYILKSTDHPIGVIHLEEDNGTTVKAIAGYELGVPAVLPDCGLSKEDILSAYKRAVRDDEGRVHIHSSFSVEDEEAFYGSIRFLVSAAGCRFIFLDHISWLGTGLADDDERKKLDRISQRLKLMAKELRFCMVMISHVNDDGKTRGSRNISKVANTVISLDRDLLTGSNATTFLVEKARLGGRTGPAGVGHFNQRTGRLELEPSAILEEE